MATKKPIRTKLIKDKIYTQEEMDQITHSEYPDDLLKGDWTREELDDIRKLREFEIALHNLKIQEAADSKK